MAIEVLDPQPGDEILEIGCGPGVAAALICERLHTGHLLVIDRSPVAIHRTAHRNAAHLASGRLAVRESTLHALDVPPQSFDKAFAINVNLFWVRRPSRELAVLKASPAAGRDLAHPLRRSGPTGNDRITSSVSAALRTTGFTAPGIPESEFGIGISAHAPATSPAGE